MGLLSRALTDWRHSMIHPYVHGDVLDLGCGDAYILNKFNGAINHYSGVEWSQQHIKHILSEFPDACIYRRNLDCDPLDLGRQFDVILLIAIVEHVWNQRFLFEQVITCLKPGGRIVITTPTPFGNDIVHRLGAKCGLFAQSAVDDHIVIYNKFRFQNVAREFGMTVIKYKRFQCFSNQLVVMAKTEI